MSDNTKVVSVRFMEADWQDLARQAKRAKLSTSDYVRQLVLEDQSGAYRILTELEQWIETSRKVLLDEDSIIVKKVGLTDQDKDLVGMWKLIYQIPEGASVFWPAVKTTVDAARAGGLSQEQLLAMIEASPGDRWFAECIRNGRPPTLPQLLTQASLDRLSQLVMLKTIKKQSLEGADLPVLKAQGARLLHDLVQGWTDEEAIATLYACLDDARDKEAIDKVIANAANLIGGGAEAHIRSLLGGTDEEEEG